MNTKDSDRCMALAHLVRGAAELDRLANGRMTPGHLSAALLGFLMSWAADDPAYVAEVADSLSASAHVLREEIARSSVERRS